MITIENICHLSSLDFLRDRVSSPLPPPKTQLPPSPRTLPVNHRLPSIPQTLDMDDAMAAPEEEKREDPSSISISSRTNPTSDSHLYRLATGWFEIRLFYVRVSPCSPAAVPPHLTLSHPRRELGVSLDINGVRVPPSEPTSLILRRDRLDTGASEVTYVSTDCVRFTGPVEFEVRDGDELVLCGYLERLEPAWGNGVVDNQVAAADKDLKTGWSMDCYSAASAGSSAFVQPKLGISSPSMEVYVAGCCSGIPLILTHTVQLSPRKKVLRQGMLDSIPEDEETTEGERKGSECVLRPRNLPSVEEGEADKYDSEVKLGHSFYAEGGYYDDDGQLSWFNAGVRVGVGIGLGMCLGVGVGVGLLMSSYQATTRTFRRRFF